MKKYIPQPISLDDIELPHELENLLEQIAENVHEVWSANRINDGWQYGLKRDDSLKLHPCLVPYEELDENEKLYDRATALASLKLIYKLGFEIIKK
ncbi:RyR domain-containing protein [Prevotella sp. 10(H)]|uniref:RyR domain-containing protein n=1 Tax=Prevotella sp. 10(H) TaxID=1158294 RepID=UPI0004A6EF2F|nr:RyR domain-containing protein [Prevotella sp. 10(H)]